MDYIKSYPLRVFIPSDLYIPPDAMKVALDEFEGPLDLLLYLIRRENNPIRNMKKKVSDSDEIQIFTSIAINKNILQKISDKIKNVLFIPLSSALKFGAIASGEGSFYPRLGPTHEWDTAAGQCLIEEAGGIVVDRNMNRLKYNKNSNFLNEEFFVIGDPSYDWKSVIDEVKKTSCEIYALEHDDPKDYKEYVLRAISNLKDI